jgi:hypothetical protein
VTLFSVGYAPLALFLAAVPWAAAACQAGAILFGRYAPLGVRGDALLVEGKKLDVRARSKLSFAARKHDEHVGVGRRHDHV